MTFEEGLWYVLGLVDADRKRFLRAAARWHARYVLETGADLGDSEMVMRALCGLSGANGLLLRRRLLERVDASGVGGRQMGKE